MPLKSSRPESGREYVLTLSCPDSAGLVHAVSGFLVRNSGNILESQQFDDRLQGRFFMRVHFDVSDPDAGLESLRHRFGPVAEALLAELEAQEQRLVLPHLTYDDAARLGATIAALAEQRQLPVVVRVEVDTEAGPHTVYQRAFPGSSPDNDWWIGAKAKVVRHYGHSSFAVGTRYRVDGTTFEQSSGLDDSHKAHGGCFPLRVDGQLVGIVAVSGLPQQDDHALVVEGLTAYLAG